MDQTDKTTTSPEPLDKIVFLGDGTEVVLRAPLAGDLRGIKLLDVLQLDTGAHAELLPRISSLEKGAFYRLGAADSLAVMGGVVAFFAPAAVPGWTPASPPASKTPTK
jgi:hypothetical protein